MKLLDYLPAILQDQGCEQRASLSGIKYLAPNFPKKMDDQLVSFTLKEKYLLVTGHGKRDNLTMMAKASAQIYEKVQETKSRFLLVDYRRLEINVSMNEAFNIVKRYEVAQPELKTLVIAAVFEGSGMAFGEYWKDVSRQRGFFIETFYNIDVAEKWLFDQIGKG